MNFKVLGISFAVSSIIFGSILIAAIGMITYDEVMTKVDIGDGIHLSDIKLKDTSTIIYDDVGKIIYKNSNGKRNSPIKIKTIPKSVYGAFVAIEDSRFFIHNGIDLVGISRAITKNLKTGRLTEGASTITQQLIKINYLSTEKTWTRKIKEQLLALDLEKKSSKMEILETYINSIYLAHGNYGIEAASNYYFDKKSKDLNPDEAAIIAGITQYPSKYSPLLHPKYAKEKAQVILKKMLRGKYITTSEYEKYKSINCLKNLVKRDLNNSNIKTSYYVDAVIKQVNQDLTEKYSSREAYDMLYVNGIRIYSNFNKKAQRAIDRVYTNDQMPIYYTTTYLIEKDGKEKYHYKKTYSRAAAKNIAQEYMNQGYRVIYQTIQQPQGAAVVVDNKTQRIIGIAGSIGKKIFSRELNRATDSVRQPGSSIKPLASYTSAFQAGYTPNTKILDEKINISGFQPKNWYLGYKGLVTMKYAVAFSMNIPAVKIADEIGVSKILDNLKNYGITTLTDQDNNLAISIGGFSKGVKLSELTKAYSVISNYGTYKTSKLYSKVNSTDSKVLLQESQTTRKVTSRKVAEYLISCMKAVVNNGTAARADLDNWKIEQSCKTGTTDESKDLWLMGFTRDYTLGIWQGYDTPKPMYDRPNLPSDNWKTIMTELMSDVESASLTSSDGTDGIGVFKSDAGKISSFYSKPVVKPQNPVVVPDTSVVPEDPNIPTEPSEPGSQIID